MVKIVLLEAHPLLRLGLWQVLSELDDDWEIEAMGVAELAAPQARHREADLLIYGLCQDPDLATSTLADIHHGLRPKSLLLLAESTPVPAALPAQAGGTARGCLAKTSPACVLDAAIRLVLAGGQCFSGEQVMPNAAVPVMHTSSLPARIEGARASMPISAGAQLLQITPRQYEVLVLLARGYPIKTVSRMLNISVATAKTHACTLYQRLHVKNKGEAVYAALQRGATLEWESSTPALPARDPGVMPVYAMCR
ncbi:helix-turn-helix transcriptional regulator [Bordetella genomosp. 5]|uniref:helix-turn-helix transcriptional regulator n=1 Tax=Bordetella genomosp. 5 TaxID=1395608 RepID=UPI000B9DD13A|nr:response regulator transcription factor [Bordetella genomosp. 5]OZI39810.1 helix-turn-helix transcriptional regulator [Bordetella genomosp. 5]